MSHPPVTFYTHTLGTGGGTRVIATLANLLSAAGYPTRVVAVHRDRNPRREWFSNLVDVCELAGSHRWRRVLALARSLRHDKGVVFSCCEFTSLLIPWLRMLGRQRFKLVIVTHTHLGQLLQSEVGNRGLRGGMRFAANAYARADMVAAVSHAVAEDLEHRLHLPQVEVLTNPVVDSEKLQGFQPTIPDSMQELRRPIVLSAGRLHRGKDLATLVDAFQLLPQGTLVLLGEGPDRSALEERVARSAAQGRVKFMGHVDNPLDYMAHADLFVLSSRYEALPTVLIEAMSVGCAVVSTDCHSGPREILEEGAHGALVPVGDVDALAAAMADSLRTPVDRSALRARANRYSHQTSLAEYLSVIRNLSD